MHFIQEHVLVLYLVAYETLSNPVIRRAYDSVDPQFDESIPGDKVSSEKFMSTFEPVFERNARYDGVKT